MIFRLRKNAGVSCYVQDWVMLIVLLMIIR
jgi:hypothetical protein